MEEIIDSKLLSILGLKSSVRNVEDKLGLSCAKLSSSRASYSNFLPSQLY